MIIFYSLEHLGEGYGGFPEQTQGLEEENDHLENSLREKVKELKVVCMMNTICLLL